MGIQNVHDHRERLGMVVREAWMAWAAERPQIKGSWLTPWADLPEDMKEADRRIGEAVERFLHEVGANNGKEGASDGR